MIVLDWAGLSTMHIQLLEQMCNPSTLYLLRPAQPGQTNRFDLYVGHLSMSAYRRRPTCQYCIPRRHLFLSSSWRRRGRTTGGWGETSDIPDRVYSRGL